MIIAKSSKSKNWWKRYFKIWKKLWMYIFVSLSFLTKFELFCNKYIIDKRILKEKKSRHVNNVRNYFNLNSFSRFRFRYRSQNLLRRRFSRSLQFIFTLTLISKFVIRWLTNWLSRTNVLHMTNQITYEENVRMSINIRNVINTKCKYFTWIWLSNQAILIRKINNSHQKHDWWMFKNFLYSLWQFVWLFHQTIIN